MSADPTPTRSAAGEPIEILAVASELPPSRPTTSVAVEAGVDVAFYHGWPRHCVAADDQHPADMAAAALARALAASGTAASELDLVLYCGVSRDYLPSWSVAMDVAFRVGARCLGLDITQGCVGLLLGLEVARGWLADRRRRVVAVVTAERWTYSIDHADVAVAALWGHSDGAAAILVGPVGPGGRRGIGRYRGASTAAMAALNGFIRVEHGGTRHPVAPAGTSPHARTVRGDSRAELFATYLSGLERAVGAASDELGAPVERVVCSQVSPLFVTAVEQRLGVAPGSVPRTGERHGHLGGADLAVALEAFVAAGVSGPVIATSSSPCCVAAGVIDLDGAGSAPR